MRGFALLDDSPVGFSSDQRVLWTNQALEAIPAAGDLIAFAPRKDAPMRDGIARIRRVDPHGEGHRLEFSRSLSIDVPLVNGADAVYVVTAIGEHIFEPGTSMPRT